MTKVMMPDGYEYEDRVETEDAWAEFIIGGWFDGQLETQEENPMSDGSKSQVVLTPEATGKPPYGRLQVRYTGNSLNIQGEGPEINRPYGVAVPVALDGEINAWAKSQFSADSKSPSVDSLATGTEQRYFKAEARRDAGDTIRLHLFGASLNRSYGACLTVSGTPELTAFLQAVAG
jgi:hypothetical protein